MATGCPRPSPTAELVGPRSMPITLPIAFSSRPLSPGRHRIARRLPGLDTSLDYLDVRETSRPIARRLTGGRVLGRSGAIEDDLRVSRHRRQQPRLQLFA